MTHILNCKAEDLLISLPPETVDLFLFDPPYFDIVGQKWDKQWKSVDDYVTWFNNIANLSYKALKPNGSFIFFGGVGSDGFRPFWCLCQALEKQGDFMCRDIITWKKRRAYGKKFSYLFCREEIGWYSKSHERTEVTFNIPYLPVKRGYAGYNKKYPAKSDYKRVSNVWDDIHELMRPHRQTEKPVPLMERLVLTHSNVDDFVVDMFAGTGTTGVAALKHKRRFLGCDIDAVAATYADNRCANV